MLFAAARSVWGCVRLLSLYRPESLQISFFCTNDHPERGAKQHAELVSFRPQTKHDGAGIDRLEISNHIVTVVRRLPSLEILIS